MRAGARDRTCCREHKLTCSFLRRRVLFCHMQSIDLSEILNIPAEEMPFFGAFDRHAVRYLLIGGSAVRFHGYLRMIDDVDVLVDNARENARRVYDAVTEIVGAQPFTVDDLCRPKKKLRPCYYYLDILTSLDWIEFDEAYRDKVTTTLSGTPIHIISKSHLILSKRDTGREKDNQDIYALERADAV